MTKGYTRIELPPVLPDAGKQYYGSRLPANDGQTPLRSRLQRWRAEQPFGWDFRTWETKHGCVVQLGQVRVYYGRCADCGCLVTTRRAIDRTHNGRLRGYGRWPDRCSACNARKASEHDAKATERMRELRARRKAFREEQFRKLDKRRKR